MVDPKLVARFEAKFEKTDGCWIWKASVAGKGYGQIKMTGQRRQEYAHRLSYLVYKGDIPEGLFVLHKCDTPRCVNPDHLFLGTCKDNLQDMAQKGRSTKGSKNPSVKLTEKQVEMIRDGVKSGMSQHQLARAFGVHQTQISRISRGIQWK